MKEAYDTINALKSRINTVEKELQALKERLSELEAQEEKPIQRHSHPHQENSPQKDKWSSKWPLTQEEYSRYGRQMIVPSIGIQGQLRLRAASVLIVGAGGLGCPAAVYIAGAGVKTLGLVDGDVVELSNLHRQILHNTTTISMWKVDSVIQHLQKLNPNVTYEPYREHLSPQNALDIISQYDLVLDCTDNPKPRYLISDACILLCKPFISASALKTDGQLMNLNYPPRPAGDPSGGPCYRCVFPRPPPPNQVISCSDGGIVGPVVGAMGVLQAVEALRLIVAGLSIADTTVSEFEQVGKGDGVPSPSLLIFSSSNPNPFRQVRLRTRRPDCFACSSKAVLTRASLTSGSLDYVAFCGELSPVRILQPDERISARDFSRLASLGKPSHILLDVREKVQFDICSLPGSINMPFSMVQGSPGANYGASSSSIPLNASSSSSLGKEQEAVVEDGDDEGSMGRSPWPEWLPAEVRSKENAHKPIYVVCRLGNDSQVVARRLKEIEMGRRRGKEKFIGDIKGGLRAWREEVDTNWPDY